MNSVVLEFYQFPVILYVFLTIQNNFVTHYYYLNVSRYIDFKTHSNSNTKSILTEYQ